MAQNIAIVSEGVKDVKGRFATIAAAEANGLAKEGTEVYRQLQA